jgi:hypothetical protein
MEYINVTTNDRIYTLITQPKTGMAFY